MGAIYLGILAVAAYGMFIGIKNLIKLFKAGAKGKKVFWKYLAFFVISPCIFTSGYYIIDKDAPNVWLIAPLLLLATMWLVTGYFIQGAYQRLGEERKQVWKQKAKAQQIIMLGFSMFLIGLLIWLVGFFNGYPNWESALVVLSIFLVLYGGLMIVRNLKYLKPKPSKKKS